MLRFQSRRRNSCSPTLIVTLVGDIYPIRFARVHGLLAIANLLEESTPQGSDELRIV
jgi:hypothetical protein